MRNCLQRNVIWVLLALLVSAFPGGPAAAETKGAPPKDPEARERIRVWNAECLSCHTYAGLQKPPRKGLDLRRLANFLVVPELFDKSNHTGMACRTCHVGGYRDYFSDEQIAAMQALVRERLDPLFGYQSEVDSPPAVGGASAAG